MTTTSSMDLQNFYPAELAILHVIEKEDTIIIRMKSKSTKFTCPDCNTVSHTHHGTYHRRVQDLPMFQKTVWLDINAYEYNCKNPVCKVGSIAETFDGFLRFRKRMTERCMKFISLLAIETSCESSAKICKYLGIRTSGDSVIRMLLDYAQNHPAPACGDCIGVDDFAYKKGQNYCTVIVNEKYHTTIDILEGRGGKALKEWLKRNKQVRTVTRDRSSAYAKAIAEELPDAMQIADRFHLHQNLMECVKDILHTKLPAYIKIPKGVSKNSELQLEVPIADDTAISGLEKKNRHDRTL